MAQPEAIAARLEMLLRPDHRGRLLARGLARGMVWRDGVIPEGASTFASSLTDDLLDFGYGTLALALELRDLNRDLPRERRHPTDEAFRVAAESLESAVRRGEPTDPERGRHLVVAAAALHLAGYAARSYSLLPESVLAQNLATPERALALLLRRDLQHLRSQALKWLMDPAHSDDAVSARLASDDDHFDSEDAAVLALTAAYHRAMGLLDSAMTLGLADTHAHSAAMLAEVVQNAALIGNIPMWWVATLTRHIADDLWEQSLHVQLAPNPPGAPPQWAGLRRSFIDLLAVRSPPQLDLWPSQLEAAARSTDTADDLITALPTSAGKTRIAELCILRTLADEKRVVYVTPLRALSAQVEHTLAKTFVPLGFSVTSLYGAAGATTADTQTLVSANVVVATPEKLDFAIRQDPSVLDDVGLVVFDEGHMIGLSSREIRYEVLIQRLLRRSDAASRRLVCLSAMFNPDDAFFKDFTGWLRHDAPGEPVHVRWRPTRQRLATIERQGRGNGRLAFVEDERPFVPGFFKAKEATKPRKNAFPHDEKEFCIAAANAFATDKHNVLIYSPQRRQVEPLVEACLTVERQGFLGGVGKPDASELESALAIGREWLGATHAAVRGLSIGVGAHHGALPRPLLSAIEELMDRSMLPIVVASPTLAQGIDLKCGVLIFRSLHRPDLSVPSKKKRIPEAEFANVLGRAGRAYVDLDGIAAYPIYATGRAAQEAMDDFANLIKESREQRLVSGLAHLVFEIIGQLSGRLGVSRDKLGEYVTNQQALWEDQRLGASGEEEEDETDQRRLDDLLDDLDVAILSIVEDLEVSTDDLAAAIDRMLTGSLWQRTLAHMAEGSRRLERDVLLSRAQWLWRSMTPEQRKASFSAGLGRRAGVYLYDRMDELVPHLAKLHLAVAREDAAAAAAAAVAFAECMEDAPFFAFGKPPDGWRETLSRWVRGVAFADILAGNDKRVAQKIQSFVQDTVIFKLVWAAEAVRVQAQAREHPEAENLGEGVALALTYGVPSIRSALLCQAGLATRTGAVWICGRLPSDFSDPPDMQRWIREHRKTIAGHGFWPSTDHDVLWRRWRRGGRGDAPREWARESVELAVSWVGCLPSVDDELRVVVSGGDAYVCTLDLEVVGKTTLPTGFLGCFVDVKRRRNGRLTAVRFCQPQQTQ
jgi:hypothetical protein